MKFFIIDRLKIIFGVGRYVVGNKVGFRFIIFVFVFIYIYMIGNIY